MWTQVDWVGGSAWGGCVSNKLGHVAINPETNCDVELGNEFLNFYSRMGGLLQRGSSE